LWPAALDAAYDVSEHEDKNVRMQGYRLVVDLARIGVGAEEVGTMTDVLLQSMYTCESSILGRTIGCEGTNSQVVSF
jgi:hypothetical protein